MDHLWIDQATYDHCGCYVSPGGSMKQRSELARPPKRASEAEQTSTAPRAQLWRQSPCRLCCQRHASGAAACPSSTLIKAISSCACSPASKTKASRWRQAAGTQMSVGRSAIELRREGGLRHVSCVAKVDFVCHVSSLYLFLTKMIKDHIFHVLTCYT